MASSKMPAESSWEGTFRSQHTADGKIKLIPAPYGKIKAGGGTMIISQPPALEAVVVKPNPI